MGMPWLETAVADVLQKVLGAFVRDINAERLQMNLWSGEVQLDELELRAEALNALELPAHILSGVLGSLRIKVPWRNLGKDKMSVQVDRIFLVASMLGPEESTGYDEKQELEMIKAKQDRVQAMEAIEEKRQAHDQVHRKAASHRMLRACLPACMLPACLLTARFVS